MCDLAALCTALAQTGDLAGFEAVHRFHEIGSPAGMGELDLLLRTRGRATSYGVTGPRTAESL